MKEISKQIWFKYIAIFTGVALLIVSIFVIQAFIVDRDAPIDTDIRSYSTLSYCSDISDDACPQNVATLDIRFRTPPPEHKGINYMMMNILIDEVRIEYYEDLTDEFTSDFILYADTNGNGVFDGSDASDQKLSKGSLDAKKLKFENVDFTAALKWVNLQSLDVSYTFFIVGEDNTDRFDHLKLDKLKVKAYDTRLPVLPQNEIYSKTSAIDKSMWMYDEFISMSRKDFLKTNDIFIANPDDKDGIIMQEGDYKIKKTIVIPTGLNVQISQGVNVKMDADTSIVSYSPVKILGTETNKVTFTRLGDDHWGVFGVIGNTKDFGEVIIKNAFFEGGYETEINGAYLSGMVSLYRATKTVVKNSKFENAYADDSLNIKYSEVDLSYSTFNNNSADAFDGDFVSGIVYNNTFGSNGNDSIDTSGSTIEIYDNYIYKSGDKCMSFGEGSDTIAINNVLYGCNIGVEVKDGSHPIIANNLFMQNNVGYNSYLKKYFYDSPSATLLNNLFVSNTEQITFNNSFTGDLLVTDMSTLTMQSNLFDSTYTFSPERSLCIDCTNNMANTNVEVGDDFIWSKSFNMTPTIKDYSLYYRYNTSDIEVGLIKSFWKQ